MDLVVTKVRITRGDWAAGSIQIVPYIKNMCNSKVTQPIKVSFPDYHTAIWLRTGLGPKQEKSAGAIYRNGGRDGSLSSFDVAVDSDNEIRENNETNIVVTIPAFPAGMSRRMHTCTLTGPHCRRGPEIKKYQIRDNLIQR